jgi:hypothetical protein
MGCGKTSIANYLVEKYNFKKFSFADDLKLYASEIFDMKVKDRKLLQQFGTKMKEIDENIWIKRLDYKIKNTGYNILDIFAKSKLPKFNNLPSSCISLSEISDVVVGVSNDKNTITPTNKEDINNIS